VGVAVSWIGHATTIVQVRDKLFITDPLLTKTVGMILKRYVVPGIDPATLPKMDFTLVSHTHFDHFSYGSLAMLPKDGTLLIPLGALRYTPDLGFRQIREMKPWDVVEEDGVRVTAVPVQHFSGRYGLDMAWMRDHGYTGYVVEYAGYTFFFRRRYRLPS
ncbi:MAG: MBL fold metallo-hydrolase, partial [Bacteroidota bacterium]